MGMIRGGGRTSAAPTLAHQQPSLDSDTGHRQNGYSMGPWYHLLACLQLTTDRRGGDNYCEDFCSAFSEDIYVSAR